MTSPYAILGVSEDANDGTIRRRYLDLIREFPPEHHHEQFARIRRAYEQIQTLDLRAEHQLYHAGREDTIESIIEEASCPTSRPRPTLAQLLEAAHRPVSG